MPNLKPNHLSKLDTENLNQFLESGWFLALDSERVLVGWGEWKASSDDNSDDNSASVSAGGETSFAAQLFAPHFFFDSEQNEMLETTSCEILERSRFASLVLSGLGPNVNNDPSAQSDEQFQWVEPDRDGFETQFASIREGMRERGLKKAVPIVFAQAKAQITKTWRQRVLAEALKQPTHLFPYGFWKSGEGMIGVTPEILFSQSEEQSFETVALAGTRAKGQDEKASAAVLLADAKERHEHQLVIDDIAAVLKKIGDAQIAQTGVVFLPTLLHLKTPISAKLSRPFRFIEIVAALHPTPALGVAPRALGFSEMRRWSSRENRRRYGAPFGARYRDEAGVERRHCVVAIRNIQWSSAETGERSEVLLGSGCGVVPASEIEREWQELQLKRDSVKRMLGV
jgi:menaquinone-specific isochorismate synthase